MLALSFASLHPDAVKRLVLVGCGTYSKTSRAEYERRTAMRSDPAKKAALKSAVASSTTPRQKRAAFTEYVAYATSLQAHDPVRDPFPGPANESDPLALDATWPDVLRLQQESVEPQRFSAITCPVTLIQGAEDPHPGRLVLDDLKPFIPHIEYREIGECGHEPWLERQAREPFLAILREILSR